MEEVVPVVEEENVVVMLLIKSENKYRNVRTVQNLYKALSSSCTGGGEKYCNNINNIASDLEWWFHGPQNCHHMMNMLTGKSSPSTNVFKFEPRSIDAIDDDECVNNNIVVVEGWEGADAYWVHVWKLKDGIITQFREYFNTWLTVTDFRPPCSTTSTDLNNNKYLLSRRRKMNTTLWQSHPRDLAKRSLPGLMLAI